MPSGVKDRTPLSISVRGVCAPDLSFVSLFSSPAFSGVLQCSHTLYLFHFHLSRFTSLSVSAFGDHLSVHSSQPLKPASPCINFPRRRISLFSLSVLISLSLSRYWSPTGCSWFNLRLDLTSGPHAVPPPFAIWPLLVCLSPFWRNGERLDSPSAFGGLWIFFHSPLF